MHLGACFRGGPGEAKTKRTPLNRSFFVAITTMPLKQNLALLFASYREKKPVDFVTFRFFSARASFIPG